MKEENSQQKQLELTLLQSIYHQWYKQSMIGQNNVKLEENLNISLELKKITFKVITKILFGRDINKINKWEYTSPKDGSVKMLNFEDAYF